MKSEERSLPWIKCPTCGEKVYTDELIAHHKDNECDLNESMNAVAKMFKVAFDRVLNTSEKEEK